MRAIDRITVNPDLCGGRPCIRGLRIRVKDVLDLLASGATREEILADYRLAFAARQNDHPCCGAHDCASWSTPAAAGPCTADRGARPHR